MLVTQSQRRVGPQGYAGLSQCDLPSRCARVAWGGHPATTVMSDHLQGGTDSRSFSRMVELLDRWASSFGVGANFSKAAKARQKKVLNCSLVLLVCFIRPYWIAKDSKNSALWSLCSISCLWNSSSWHRVPKVFGHVESYGFLWSGNSAAAASETRAQGLPITSEKKICTFKNFTHYLWKQRTLSKEKLLIP